MSTRLNAQIRKVLLGVMLGGIALFLCFGAGGLPVSRAQQAGTPEPTDDYTVNTITPSDGTAIEEAIINGPAAQSFAFTYSPVVANLIAQVQSAQVYSYTARLSGEAPIVVGGQTVTLTTRHTKSGLHIQRATQYAYEQLQALGLGVSYQTWAACSTNGRNVIGVITGTVTPSEIVLITAHLDNMPSNGRAPGADDNASGSVGVLLAAQLMHDPAVHFDRTLRFVLFTGEEQGLCGSGAYAAAVSAAGDNIVAVYNLDMIAWDGTGGPTLRLHTRTTGSAGYPADLAIAGVFTNVVSAYGLSGGLTPIIDPDGESRSDHAQFWARGYPAILAIEDENDFNPYYHSLNDNLAHINLTYFTNFVKASVGAAAHLARPSADISYTLTVTTTGTGQGAVIAAYGTGTVLLPAQIPNVAPGTVITLTAVPSATSVFAGWSGAVTGLTNLVTVTMNADKVVTATFNLIPTYTLTVKMAGTGQGAVIAGYGTGTVLLPGSVQLPAQITNIAPGTVITLTAVPSTTSAFAGWSGAATGLINPVTVTMTADKVVTATFSLNADLSVTENVVRAGNDIIYTIVARNAGPGAASAAVVSSIFPTEVVNVTWTCASSGGAVCGGGGSGNSLADTLTTFPIGGMVIYTVRGTLGLSAMGNNVVTITPPSGVVDHNQNNNLAGGYRLLLPIVFKNQQP